MGLPRNLFKRTKKPADKTPVENPSKLSVPVTVPIVPANTPVYNNDAFLVEDEIIPSQRFTLFSVVGPNSSQTCNIWALKIRGSYPTKELSVKAAEKLSEVDPDYDIVTVETGKFFPLVVNPDEIEETTHANKELGDMVREYKNGIRKANLEFSRRKQKALNATLEEGNNDKVLDAYVSIRNIENRLKDLESQIKENTTLQSEYKAAFELFTEEEKTEAEAKYEKLVEENVLNV